MGKTKNQSSETSAPKRNRGQSFRHLRQLDKIKKQRMIAIDCQEISADIGDSCRWIVVQAVANDRNSPRGELWSDIYTAIFRPLSNKQSGEVNIALNEDRLQEMIDLLQETLAELELEEQEAETYPLVQALNADLKMIQGKLKGK